MMMERGRRIPEKIGMFYRLQEASDRVRCTVNDIIRYGISEKIRLAYRYSGPAFKNPNGEVNYKIKDGDRLDFSGEFVFLQPFDLMELFDASGLSSNPSNDVSIETNIFVSDEHGVIETAEYGIGSVISVSYRDLYLFESEVSKLQRIIDGKEELIAPNALMDRQYAWHSEELHIAVSAWSELYMLNPPSSKPPGGHKNYIKSWLKEKHPQLSANAIERISVVVNPNPSGGASPTPE